MTIDRQGTGYVVHCDFCPEYLEMESDDSEYVMSELKRIGWHFQKDDNDCWENVCPVCQRIPGVAKW